MNALVVFRDTLKRLYAEYDMFVKPVLRFLVCFVFLILLRNYVGYNETLCRPVVLLVLSLVSALFPAGFITFICTVFVLGNMYGVSLSLLLLGSILFLLVVMLYFGFRPGKGFYIILIPMAFLCKVPYCMPVILALTGGLSAAVPVSIGVVFWYILEYFHNNASVLEFSKNPLTIISEFIDLVQSIFTNKSMYVLLAAFLICIGIVYFISKLNLDHNWTIAVISGLIVLCGISIAGNIYLGTDFSITTELIRTLIALPIVIIYELIFFSVDYRATEHLQFEDDQYYYYVKAVPKITADDETTRRE